MTMDINEFAVKFGAIVSEPGVSPETMLDTWTDGTALGR